jgi:hypothetical protein
VREIQPGYDEDEPNVSCHFIPGPAQKPEKALSDECRTTRKPYNWHQSPKIHSMRRNPGLWALKHLIDVKLERLRPIRRIGFTILLMHCGMGSAKRPYFNCTEEYNDWVFSWRGAK